MGLEVTKDVVPKAKARFFKKIVETEHPNDLHEYAAYYFFSHSTSTPKERTKLDFPGECSIVGFYHQLIKRLKEELAKLNNEETTNNSTISD